MKRAEHRGSRKHILDWVEEEEFASELTSLLEPMDAMVTVENTWKPIGYRAPDEARLERFGPEVLPDVVDWQTLSDWWLCYKRGANTPNWDLALTATVGGRKGLVLVEAKAHESELNDERKPLDPDASEHSRANHRRIGFAIDEACRALNRVVPGIQISRDSHYQLANRIAFSYKLAAMGLPVVLVYLGFLGDTGIADVGVPFIDDAHWTSVFQEHTHGILPDRFAERSIDCGLATMQMIERSRPVLEVSSNPHALEQRLGQEPTISPAIAVEVIRRKLAAAGGSAKIPKLRGAPFTAQLTDDGVRVDNLGTQPDLPWAVFREAVALLIRNGGQASRGDAMQGKLGDERLPLNSVEGHIAHAVYGRRLGDSVFRRITPIVCVLIWAGLCEAAVGRVMLPTFGR